MALRCCNRNEIFAVQKMIAYRILEVTCCFIAVATIHAKIPYDEIQFNIFDNRTRDFELNTITLMQTVKNYFAGDDALVVISAGLIALKEGNYVNEIGRLIQLLQRTLNDQSEWQSEFAMAISSEAMRAVTESEVRWMESSMQTIQTKIKLLANDESDVENQDTIASIIHTDLDRMINFFDIKSSLFRKYPLMGAPLLIQLASLVALFSPIAKSLIPLEAMNPQISCKMRDVLVDYRPRVVNARLHEFPIGSFNSRTKVMRLPYNSNGYNQTNPGAIDCKIGCKSDKQICFKDKFSSNTYEISIINGTSKCVENYAELVRYRVEALFPVELLSKLCVDQKTRTPTGNSSG